MTDTAEAKTGERTAGPWRINPHTKTMFRTDRPTAFEWTIGECFRGPRCSREEAEANAAYIVQACNGFPALVEALELIAGGFEGEGLEVENQWRKEVARSALEAAMKTEGR